MPSRPHYTFIVRDRWKVVQGMCSASGKHSNFGRKLGHLFYHENLRIYHDRLINDTDRKLFIAKMEPLVSAIISHSQKFTDKEAEAERAEE